MPKKTASDVSDQTETEYFVSFFEMEYPDCRSAVHYEEVDNPFNVLLVYNDEIIKIQRQDKKKCFQSRCEKSKCDMKDPDCYMKCVRDSHAPVECHADSMSDCLVFPFTCATSHCLEADKIPKYCVYIGLLTLQELKRFENRAVELKNTYDDCGYFVQLREELCEASFEAMERYNIAVKNLEPRSGRRNSKYENPINVLERYEGYAASIRTAWKSPPSSVADPVFGVSNISSVVATSSEAISVTPIALPVVPETVVEHEDILDLFEKVKGQGRWVSQTDFSNLDINKEYLTKGTLRKYRETGNATWSKKNPAIGQDKAGNFLKRKSKSRKGKEGKARYNYRYSYFLLREFDKQPPSLLPVESDDK